MEAPCPFQDDPVHEAMAFVTDNTAYMQAVDLCPQVLQDESPHSQFFAFCSYNAWDAAERLSIYWKMRMQAFGPHAAFLPMKEALTSEDQACIASGIIEVILSPDDKVPSVFCIDRSRIKPGEFPSEEARIHSFWFFLQCIMDQARRTGNCEFLGLLYVHQM
jgi:hypothetical protein